MIAAFAAAVLVGVWQARRQRGRVRVVDRLRAPPVAAPSRQRHRRGHRQTGPDADAVVTLPDAVDLLAVAVDAGLPAVLAVDAVAPRARPPWSAALGAVADRVARGQLFVDALGELAICGDPGRRLAGVLRGGAHGGDLAGALERLARDARDLRRRRAEEAARRVPVRLLAPLVLCVLPAFVLLALVPLVAGAFDELHL